MKKDFLSSIVSFTAMLVITGVPIILQPSAHEIKVGSKIPEFALKDQNAKVFDVKNVLGKKNLVIFFYIKDETPGCTKEACSFRDSYEEFQKTQAMIIGISAQLPGSHKTFADKYKLPFTLLSDKNNEVRKMFGVMTDENGSIPGRVTFIIDKTGKVVDIFDSNTQPEQHVKEALRILGEIKK